MHPGRRLTRLTFEVRRNIDVRYRSPLHFLELWSITGALSCRAGATTTVSCPPRTGIIYWRVSSRKTFRTSRSLFHVLTRPNFSLPLFHELRSQGAIFLREHSPRKRVQFNPGVTPRARNSDSRRNCIGSDRFSVLFYLSLMPRSPQGPSSLVMTHRGVEGFLCTFIRHL